MIGTEGYLGSSRLGLAEVGRNMLGEFSAGDKFSLYKGAKRYELTNHLGNVLSVVSDELTPNGEAQVISAKDYYPFGMSMPSRTTEGGTYRYGFNGKEKDTETDLNDFGARFYAANLGRWLSIDPLAAKFPNWSPYNFTFNNPIIFIDPSGQEPIKPLVGTIKQVVEQFRNQGITTVSQIRDFYANPRNITGNALTPYVRYVHTKENGWIDMRHFFASAVLGEKTMDAGELSQCVGGLPSCYSYEDLPSNRFGGESSDALKEMVSIDPAGITVPMFREGENLFGALENVFENAGCTIPEAAINFDKLPIRERGKVPDFKIVTLPISGGVTIRHYTAEEKEKLIQTGKYIPQNFTDRPYNLNNFPTPDSEYLKPK